jgi:hypothetical protein
MQGTWNVTGDLGSQGPGPYTYQVTFVSSPCSVASPVGTFSVDGPVCFIANNNSGQGSITGKGLLTSAKNAGEGVLMGVSANPVPDNSTINLLFVLGEANGNFVEFTGSATVANGKMTGTGSCSTNTPMCQGMSATFSATPQLGTTGREYRGLKSARPATIASILTGRILESIKNQVIG